MNIKRNCCILLDLFHHYIPVCGYLSLKPFLTDAATTTTFKYALLFSEGCIIFKDLPHKLQDPKCQNRVLSYHSGINKWQENKNKCGVASSGIMLIPDFTKIHPLFEKLLRLSQMDMIWMVTHSVIYTPKL